MITCAARVARENLDVKVMKTIISGSRSITDYASLLLAISKCDIEITEILSGAANGVDRLGERYAKENGLPLQKFQANWNKHGKAAGPIRNEEMAKNADALLALWDGKSRGTQDMINRAGKYKLKICVHHFFLTD